MLLIIGFVLIIICAGYWKFYMSKETGSGTVGTGSGTGTAKVSQETTALQAALAQQIAAEEELTKQGAAFAKTHQSSQQAAQKLQEVDPTNQEAVIRATQAYNEEIAAVSANARKLELAMLASKKSAQAVQEAKLLSPS